MKSTQAIRFELADASDDAQLRELLRSIRMEGIISVSFRREPHYFAAHQCEGDTVQVIVARDIESQRIVGMGSRSLRKLFVNGIAQNLGYLSGLRIHENYRRGTMLARGYRFLRKLDEDQQADYYLTTIAAENRPALDALVGARGGLPNYKRIGRYVTWIVPRTVGRMPRNINHEIRQITHSDGPNVVRFIEQCSQTRQFIPKYLEKDFQFPSARFPGMKATHLKGAWLDGQLVATLGMWDQREMKQIVVERYSKWLQWLRPIYNAWAIMAKRSRLPKPGQCLPLVATALPLSNSVGLPLFGDLVDQLSCELPDNADAMMIGLSENDPLTDSVRKRANRSYSTEIYLVAWEEQRIAIDFGDCLIPYLELGTL